MIVKKEALIDAPIEQVYAVIADYEIGHRAILPKPYFQSMEVLAGGQGAGTEIFITMRVMGQAFTYHQRVTEAVKGRQIVERDINTGLASTFDLDPITVQQTKVTITSEIALSGGFMSLIERAFNPIIIGAILKKELRNLQDYVRQSQVAKV